MKIFYGIPGHYIDVTTLVMNHYVHDKVIHLPSTDHELASIFTDPIVGHLKHIMVQNDQGQERRFFDFQSKIIPLDLDFTLPQSEIKPVLKLWWNQVGKNLPIGDQKLAGIHTRIKFQYGSMAHEYPEQLMVVNFLRPEAKVLEIGGNIGRNSVIIATVLNDDRNLVTLESDPISYQMSIVNRDQNDFHYTIENCALSSRKLIQTGWNTIPSDVVLPGYQAVNTITYDVLKTKYNLTFDTLVADCEGALYYILQDTPQLLDTLTQIIMENDYHDINQKIWIDGLLTAKGFKVTYSQGGGWGPCADNFFEVWSRVLPSQ